MMEVTHLRVVSRSVRDYEDGGVCESLVDHRKLSAALGLLSASQPRLFTQLQPNFNHDPGAKKLLRKLAGRIQVFDSSMTLRCLRPMNQQFWWFKPQVLDHLE